MECVWDMEQKIKFQINLFLRKVNGFFSSLIKDYTNQTEHRMFFFYQPEYLFKGSGFL